MSKNGYKKHQTSKLHQISMPQILFTPAKTRAHNAAFPIQSRQCRCQKGGILSNNFKYMYILQLSTTVLIKIATNINITNDHFPQEIISAVKLWTLMKMINKSAVEN